MPDILISNERWKATSNLSLAFCGGLLAASAARVWEIGDLDGSASVWLVVGLAFGFFAWLTLGFLVPEGAQ
ncbi:MAG TPA: hypothetical protein VF547_02120 [Allosphingosinicella sp.]|jgi:hypothetical protein